MTFFSTFDGKRDVGQLLTLKVWRGAFIIALYLCFCRHVLFVLAEGFGV